MSTALQKIEMPTWATNALQSFVNNDAVELMLPAVPISSDLARGYKAEASVVQLSADLGAGDVFKVGRKEVGGQWVDTFGYTKTALTKLAQQAGIQYKTDRIDDRRDPDVCAFKCHAVMRSAAGELLHVTASKEFRFSEYAEIRLLEMKAVNDKATGKYKKTEEELRAAWSAETLQMRKHKEAQTETKAILRAIRAMLSIKGGMTAAEVSKPKVVLRFVPDLNDPEMRQAIHARGADAAAALYPPTRSDSYALAVDAGTPIRELPPADDDGDEVETTTAPAPAAATPAVDNGAARRGFYAALDEAITGAMVIERVEGGPQIVLSAEMKATTDVGKKLRRELLAEIFGCATDPNGMTPEQWEQARLQLKTRATQASSALAAGQD